MKPLILLVEDTPGDARLLLEALAEAEVDADIDHRLDGGDAIRHLVATAEADGRLPDLVVTNLHLPDVNGDQLIGLIRGRLDLAHLPIVVLTTSDEDLDRERCRDADAYCVKSGGWDEILEVARRIGDLLAARRERRRPR